MINLYTITLREFVEHGGNTHRDKFDNIPQFIWENITYNAYDLFLTKYSLREIGAETEELFSEYLSIKLDEVIIKYSQKITLFMDNFNNLMKRSIKMQRKITDENTHTINGEYTKNASNSEYANPITTDNNPKLQDLSKYVDTDTQHKTDTINSEKIEDYEQAYSFFKSNGELLEQAMKIKNIYYEMIDEFGELFMGVY